MNQRKLIPIHSRLFLNLFFIISFIFLCGCAKLAHLQQLLTIKAYSDNKDVQENFVSKQNGDFERLLQDVQARGLDDYQTKKELIEAYGPPVFSREVVRNDKTVEMCLYRYATEYWDASKIYVYFDQESRLVDWELVPPPPKTSNDNAT